MLREETMTAVITAFGQLVDENGVCRGGVQSITAQIAGVLGIHDYTVRRMLPTLRELGVINGPVPIRRTSNRILQDYEWRLLKPGAVIVRLDSGFYEVQETPSE